MIYDVIVVGAGPGMELAAKAAWVAERRLGKELMGAMASRGEAT